MTILYPNPARVKAARKPFGLGIARPGRQRLAPYTAADLAWLSSATPCPATAPTDAEYREHVESTTMSRSEYAAFLAEARSAELDRYAACESAELAEFGITAAQMDELARESAELDAVCGYSFAPAIDPLPTARKPRRRVETLHTRHRAARGL